MSTFFRLVFLTVALSFLGLGMALPITHADQLPVSTAVPDTSASPTPSPTTLPQTGESSLNVILIAAGITAVLFVVSRALSKEK